MRLTVSRYAQFLPAPLAPKAPAGLPVVGCPVVASTDTLPGWDGTAERKTARAPLRRSQSVPKPLPMKKRDGSAS